MPLKSPDHIIRQDIGQKYWHTITFAIIYETVITEMEMSPFLSLVTITTSSIASGKNFMEMTHFLFNIKVYQRTVLWMVIINNFSCTVLFHLSYSNAGIGYSD